MLYFRTLILFAICFPTFVFAQVGIGTTSPDASAKLQIDASASGNAKGLLPPRVALSATNSNLPFSVTPATGLLVYNTASVGSGATAVTPGFYYYSGTAWTRLIIPTDESFFVTLNTAQTVAGIKTFSNDLVANGLVVGRGKGSGNYVYNTAVGVGTLDNNTSGWGNTGVGYHSLKANTSGMGNSAFGFQGQMSGSTGNGNTSFGFASLIDNTTGSNNTSIGYQALQKNNGSNNIAIGSNAMYLAQNATQNIVVGSNSLTGATVNGVSNNIILGNSVLQNVTNAANNVVIGMGAGTSNFTNESNNTLVGYGTQLGASGLTNATAIGYGATVTATNTIQLGNNSITNVNTSGTVTSAGFVKSGGTSSQFLMADGSATSSPSLSNATSLPLTSGVTGTLPVANGGTGVNTSTGIGSVVLSTSPTLTTPIISPTTNSSSAGAVRYSTSSGGVLEYSNGTAWNTLSSNVQKANVYASRTSSSTFDVLHNTENSLNNFNINSGAGNVAGTWSSSTGVYTAPRTGLYTISAGISFVQKTASTSYGIFHFLVMKGGLNGTESCNQALPVNIPLNQAMSANISCSVPLNAGETLQIKYLQWTGGTVTVSLDPSYQGRYYISIIEN